MAWTYSQDPSTSQKDGLRLLIGDTDDTKPMMEDEELLFLLSTYHFPYGAAANACQTLAAKFARKSRQEIGDIKQYLNMQYEHYRDLAQYYFMLESGLIPGTGDPNVGGGFGNAVPFAGGIDSPSIFSREM
jgi:hypothetical protein